MKFLPIVFIVAAIFVAGSNGGSPSEPKVCDVVLKIVFEFTEFTSTLLRLYVLNVPRSDDDKEKNMDVLCDKVESHSEVPGADKEKMRGLCKQGDFEKRAWIDQLTRANIWDCFVEIFHLGLHEYSA
ncbi:unnamed protein product [Chironomus riparius]|nr:unnamed protein product [Chironomus riparius]CAH1721983.1 unnamed protein product [Chironomus riparius]